MRKIGRAHQAIRRATIPDDVCREKECSRISKKAFDKIAAGLNEALEIARGNAESVFVYVNTSKQVGDAEHVKAFANADARTPGLRKTTRKTWPLSTM
jgi:hypothetical protein